MALGRVRRDHPAPHDLCGRTVDPQAFRATCAQFATGIVVVTAHTSEGDFGSTVNSFTSLSLDPPQVIVCLAHTSNTGVAVRRANAFAVNVLASDQLDLGRHFASKAPDKMAAADYTYGVCGAPVLRGALSIFECTVVETLPRETHAIIIGEVLRVSSDVTKHPAVFFRSRMHTGFDGSPPPR